MVKSQSRNRNQSGFSLVEFLLTSLITLVIACAAFALLADVQRAAFRQADAQDAQNNVRSAMDAVVRNLRHAANDPLGAGFDGITIVSPAEVRLRSDFTGSEGTSDPDKGEADGDTDDSAEDVVLRYNAADRALEIVPGGGSPQAIASNISAFDLRFVDAEGNETAQATAIRAAKISITGEGALPDPFSKRPFSIQIIGYVRIATRR